MGISKLWDKPDRDPVLMRDGQVMSALDFIKSDDTSDVVFTDAAAAEGDDAVVRGAVGKKVGGLKPPGKAIEGCSNIDPGEIYVPGWKVTIADSFKSPSVCEDVLTHFAPQVVRTSYSSMDDDQMIAKMIMGACNLSALLLEGISHFQKRMQEYEAFLKKRDAMNASIAALKKESKGFAEKEKVWQVKVHELTQRHEIEVNELKKQVEASLKEKEELEASLAQLAKDNKWLIEHGFQQVVTYLLHSSEFNSALGDLYTKLLVYGRHQGYTAGYEACQAGTPKDKSSLYQPKAFEVFKDSILNMEHLTYPYVGEVSECFGKPLSVLQELKPRGLNEAVCNEVLKSLSRKRPCSGDSEETCSEVGEGSKGSSLEASEAVGAAGRKKRKAKKTQDDGGSKKDDVAKPTVSDAAK
ncbi:hypothetical protein HanIR_Chr15g0742641 [Helianthus annuus]|nr:hypothetical protein HanIR_Chr15g0742641 [Helianthus annuus]